MQAQNQETQSDDRSVGANTMSKAMSYAAVLKSRLTHAPVSPIASKERRKTEQA